MRCKISQLYKTPPPFDKKNLSSNNISNSLPKYIILSTIEIETINKINNIKYENKLIQPNIKFHVRVSKFWMVMDL